MRNKFFCCGLLLLQACTLRTEDTGHLIHAETGTQIQFENIGKIPVPYGYSRITVQAGSFSEWLRGHSPADN